MMNNIIAKKCPHCNGIMSIFGCVNINCPTYTAYPLNGNNEDVPLTIKRECELCYEQIRNAQQRLTEIREACGHENTFEGYYSYRVGSVLPAIICSDCGQLIKYK